MLGLQTRALHYSGPSPPPRSHTSSGYVISLQMARMTASVRDKGLAGKSASLAPGQGSSSSRPPAQPTPSPGAFLRARAGQRSRLALAHCFLNSLFPTSQGYSSCFKQRAFL